MCRCGFPGGATSGQAAPPILPDDAGGLRLSAKIIKSAERTVQVFEFFARVRRPATVSEVEDALQIPQSSTSVLLRSLSELGYLEYLAEDRMYRPTLRVTLLGDWLKPALPEDILTERLDDLHRKTQETILVGRQQGSQIQYVYTLRPNQELQFYMQEGARQPLSTSASGRALLSALSDQAVRRIARRNNAEAGVHVDEGRLLEAVREVRRTGVSETDPALSGEREIHAVATLLPRKTGSEQIALGIAGPKERMLKRRAEIIEILRDYTESHE
jgi:DNA-binding IclR family transcriptional regulator